MMKSAKLRLVILCVVLSLLLLYLYVDYRNRTSPPTVPKGSHTVIWIATDAETTDKDVWLFVPLKINDKASIERIRDAINEDYRLGGPKDYQSAMMGLGQMVAFCYEDGQSVTYSLLGDIHYLLDKEERFYDAKRTAAVLNGLRAEGKTSEIEWDEAVKAASIFRHHVHMNEEYKKIQKQLEEYEQRKREEAEADIRKFVPASRVTSEAKR